MDKNIAKIISEMKKSGYSENFILNAIQTAGEFEGVRGLINLWMNESDAKEKEEIIADIQDMIDLCGQKTKHEVAHIKFNDLEKIAKDIRVFKDSLLQIVNEQGGIGHLAKLTGMPQPSISRFFTSNSMPRRTTLFKIAKALNLDAVKVEFLWTK